MRKIAVIFAMMSILIVAKLPAAEEAPGAPDFSLQDMNNVTVTLSDYKNKQPVLLFFWTTWCPYCREQIKALSKLYPELTKDGIEVLALNLRESHQRVERFMKSYAIPYRVLLDKEAEASYSYGVVGIPTYFLVNKKGYVVFQDNYFPKEEYKELIKQEAINGAEDR